MKKPVIIGIAGGTGSGKSTITKELIKLIDEKDVTIIEQDSYYKDQSNLPFEERVKTNYDHPFAFDNELLVSQLKDLIAGKAIEKPVYDFSIHNRTEETKRVEPKDVIILEGILILAEKEIREKISKDNFMTWRFSPGYGDLPITIQREFVRVTDAEKRIGLTVNEGGILLPRKSVTAIIGLSKEPIPKQRRGCAYCNMNKTCQFRKGGTHCGF